MHITTQALVLREVSYKEADKILTLLTREAGKLTVTSRGCRRKNSPLAASSQLLSWSDMVLYEHQGRWSIKEATAQRLFTGVQGDLIQFSLACYFSQLTELLAVEGEISPELLSLLLNSLHILEQGELPLSQVKAVFELRLMCLSGYTPMLEPCAICGKEPAQGRFHLRDGVLHCAACRSRPDSGITVPVNAGALAALRHIAWGSAKRSFSFQLESASLEQLAALTEAYLLTQMERGFHTLDFYKQMTALHPPAGPKTT